MRTELIIATNWRERFRQYQEQGCPVCRIERAGDDWEESVMGLVGCRFEKPAVIGDISLGNVASKLLKFVEETQTHIICLASRDVFTPVFLSRFLVIEKDIKAIKQDGNYAEEFLEAVRGQKTEESEGVMDIVVKHAPSCMPLAVYYTRSQLVGKRKLLGGI